MSTNVGSSIQHLSLADHIMKSRCSTIKVKRRFLVTYTAVCCFELKVKKEQVMAIAKDEPLSVSQK